MVWVPLIGRGSHHWGSLENFPSCKKKHMFCAMKCLFNMVFGVTWWNMLWVCSNLLCSNNAYDNETFTCQVLPSDHFGCFKWPFQGLSDLHLGDQKVTWQKLVRARFQVLQLEPLCIKPFGNVFSTPLAGVGEGGRGVISTRNTNTLINNTYRFLTKKPKKHTSLK